MARIEMAVILYERTVPNKLIVSTLNIFKSFESISFLDFFELEQQIINYDDSFFVLFSSRVDENRLKTLLPNDGREISVALMTDEEGTREGVTYMNWYILWSKAKLQLDTLDEEVAQSMLNSIKVPNVNDRRIVEYLEQYMDSTGEYFILKLLEDHYSAMVVKGKNMLDLKRRDVEKVKRNSTFRIIDDVNVRLCVTNNLEPVFQLFETYDTVMAIDICLRREVLKVVVVSSTNDTFKSLGKAYKRTGLASFYELPLTHGLNVVLELNIQTL